MGFELAILGRVKLPALGETPFGKASTAGVPHVKNMGIVHHHFQHPKENLPPPLDGFPSKCIVGGHLVPPIDTSQMLIVVVD